MFHVCVYVLNTSHTYGKLNAPQAAGSWPTISASLNKVCNGIYVPSIDKIPVYMPVR